MSVTTTFVLPVFNAADVLAATIDSVLEQTDTDFELIVVDDGSTDSTPELLARYAERDPRVRVITQSNAGITRALIAGCAAARGKYIARQDAGDLSHPRRLAIQKALFADDEVMFVSCATQYVGPGLEPLWVSRPSGLAWEATNVVDPSLPHMLKDGPTHHGSVMFRRAAYEAAGGYRPDFYYGQDFDLWYRLAQSGKFRSTPEVLYTARITPGSLSASARNEQQRLADLSRQALQARLRGESEEAILQAASAVRPVTKRVRRAAREGLYFIGETLRRNGDPRAGGYLRRARSVKSSIRLLQFWLTALHRRAGLKYRFDRWKNYVRRFGLAGTIRVRRQLTGKSRELERVSVPGIPNALSVRPRTADDSTLEHIYVWNAYELPYPSDVRTVFDAGANIGLASVYFANRFPNARIIALEPEPGNFALLRENTAAYPNVTAIEAGLWSHDTTLDLSNPEDRVDSYRFGASQDAGGVPAFSIPTLMERFGVSSIDVLKIDIEGGETDVFADCRQWIDRVRMFVVELHGAEARAVFESATGMLNGTRFRRGEHDVLIVKGSDE